MDLAEKIYGIIKVEGKTQYLGAGKFERTCKRRGTRLTISQIIDDLGQIKMTFVYYNSQRSVYEARGNNPNEVKVETFRKGEWIKSIDKWYRSRQPYLFEF